MQDFRTKIGANLLESLGNIPGVQMIQDIRERRKLEKEIQTRSFHEAARLINKTTKEASNLARILSANEDAVRTAVEASGHNADLVLHSILEVQKDSLVNAGEMDEEQRRAVIGRLESLSGMIETMPKDMALQMDVGDTFEKFHDIFSRQNASANSQTEVLQDVNEMLKFLGRDGLDFGDLTKATQDEVEELRKVINGFRTEFRGKKLNLTLEQMTGAFDVLTVSSEEIRDRLSRKTSIGKTVGDTFKEKVDTGELKESLLTGIGTMALGPWFGVAKEIGSMVNIGSFTDLFTGDKDAESAAKEQVKGQKKQEAEVSAQELKRSVQGQISAKPVESTVNALSVPSDVRPVASVSEPIAVAQRVPDTMISDSGGIYSLISSMADKQDYANELSVEGIYEFQKMVVGLNEIDDQFKIMNEHLWDMNRAGGGDSTTAKKVEESSGFISSLMGTIGGFVSANIMAPLGAFATSIIAKSGLAAVGSSIAGAFSAGVGGVTAGITGALSAGASAVGTAITAGVSGLGAAVTAMGSAVATGATAFATGATAFASTVAGAATGAVSMIGSAVASIGTVVSGLATGAMSFAASVGTAVTGAVSSIGTALMAAGPAIGLAVAGAVGAAVGTAINDYLLTKGQKEAIGGALTGDMVSEDEQKAQEAKKGVEKRGREAKKQKLDQRLSPGIKSDKFLYSKIMNVPGKLREYLSRGIIVESGGRYSKAGEGQGAPVESVESFQPQESGEAVVHAEPSVTTTGAQSVAPVHGAGAGADQILSSVPGSVVPVKMEQKSGIKVESMANKDNEVRTMSTAMERMLQMQVQQQPPQQQGGVFRRSAQVGSKNSVAPMQVDDLGLILLNAGAF